MSILSPVTEERPALTRSRAGTLVLSVFLATIALIGVVWWPLLEAYLATWNPQVPWWAQVDWLLLAIFGAMSVLIMVGADIRRDAWIAGIGLMGGLVIESWGTQTGLWTYYTAERPPLWIIPAWPVASLAIDRLARLLEQPTRRLGRRATAALYGALFGGFAILMAIFVWPSARFSLTVAAGVLCAFLIATPVQPRTAIAVFIAGVGLGYFLELWGTTRFCWTYYTLETPPPFAVLAHGMAAVAFWRSWLALGAVTRRFAARGFPSLTVGPGSRPPPAHPG
jgi:hypothetical protein